MTTLPPPSPPESYNGTNKYQLFGQQTARLEFRSILDNWEVIRPLWCEFCNDVSLYPFFGISITTPLPDRLCDAWLKNIAERQYNNEQGCFNAIYEKHEFGGEFVGFAGLIVQDIPIVDIHDGGDVTAHGDDEMSSTQMSNEQTNKEFLEISYSLHPKKRGKGYATEVTQYLRDVAFNTDINGQLQSDVTNKYGDELVSMIHPENYPSINVAEKNGMLIKHRITYRKNPNFRLYHITREMWENNNAGKVSVVTHQQ